MLLKVLIYCVDSITNEVHMGQSAAVVIDLARDYLSTGHALHMDNYYNGVGLGKYLSSKQTYLCGTLRFDRKENPKDVVSKKLKVGQFAWKRSYDVVVMIWKDKRDVLAISNMHNLSMVNVTNKRGHESL